MTFKIGTVNIRGLTKYRYNLEFFLNNNKIDVIGIQESLITNIKQTPNISGYCHFTKIGKLRSTGITIYVKNK